MYISIHIYVYIYMYIHTTIYKCMYIYICIYVYVYKYTYTYLYRTDPSETFITTRQHAASYCHTLQQAAPYTLQHTTFWSFPL